MHVQELLSFHFFDPLTILMGIFKSTTVLLLLIHTFLWLLLSSGVCYGVLSDVHCLKTLKDSLEDPLNSLSSTWNFSNDTEGFICEFNGVECWHSDESKVLNLRLSGMGLQGEFPKGIENCSSMIGLDLSNNQLSGPIPSDIGKRIPYMTKLDLSSNGFSGEIPASLSSCQFMNVLKLDNNRFTGQIPLLLGSLLRLKTFSVTNNLLSGHIPSFVSSTFPASSYANNPGLCGKPLDVCRGKQESLVIDRDVVILGLVVYFVVTVLSSWCWYWLLFAEIKRKTPNNQTTRQRASRETRRSSILPS